MFTETEIKQIVAISVLRAAKKCSKFVFGAWALPRTPRGSSRRSPRPPSRLGRGTPPPHSPPLSASILTPSAFVSAPRFQRSATSFLQFNHYCEHPPCYHLRHADVVSHSLRLNVNFGQAWTGLCAIAPWINKQ